MASQIGEAFVRVRAVADTRSFEQSTQRALKGNQQMNRSLQESERQFGRFSRGALVGTGALSGLGRAAAFASVSFLGGAGLIYGIKSTVAAAEDAQVALTQTQQALRNSGLSWDQYGERIQKASLATAQLSGFDDERLLKTFSNLVRRTGDVNRALYLNSLAADVARGRNIELEQAQQLVLKASIGQVGALRRLGLNLKAGASGYEAINFLAEKYAGSAQKYGETAAGAQARFQVALQNTQELIGQTVLPTVTKLLDKGTEWLNDTKNQERIQKDLDAAVKTSTTVIEGLAKAIGGVHDAYVSLKNLPGGNRGLIDILGGAARGALGTGPNTPGGLLGLGSGSKETQLQGVPGFGGTSAISLLMQAAGVSPDALETGHGGSTFPSAVAAKLAAAVTRDQRTAVALARAQAEGTNKAIVAASKTRISFLRDTIAFAKNLISQHRGNTKDLEATLRSLYGEEGSDQGIIDGIAQDAADAAAQRAQDAKTKADKAAKAAKKIADEAARTAKENAAKVAASVATWNKARLDAISESIKAGQAYSASFRALIATRGAENRKDAAAAKATRAESALLGLQNDYLEAELIKNPEKRLAAERKAQKAIIDNYQAVYNTLVKQHAGILKIRQAYTDVLTAKLALASLTAAKKDKAGGGFSLQQLFAEAGSELQTYGSNIGAGPLSPQDARGAFAATVKNAQTTVNQYFYGARPTGQALADARAVARNSK